MSSKDDYDVKIDVINAVPDDLVKTSHNIPVDTYVQEAENLHKWCRKDQEALTAKGLDWNLVTDIPLRSGALREAESLWSNERFSREEAQKLWKEKSPLTYQLRNSLLLDFRFAFRKDEEFMGRIKAIADGDSNADTIQDLNDLSVLGREKSGPLTAINYDMSLIDLAAQTADEMAELLATATGERIDASESKKIRDRAYAHLKEAVDEIHAYGQYVFRNNEDRLKGYRSNYLRRVRSKYASATEPTGEETPETPPAES
ncbi:MAG: hypothetical protein GY950_07800 [bacterium]|nr:hypothetical protein [bacterium]